ncbi:MAG: hypothetical protein ACF8PN_08220 [Phycisphaerales bacterium]
MPVTPTPRASSNQGQSKPKQAPVVVEAPDELMADLNGLCQEAIAGMRAMLEHGTREDRVAVFRALAPMIREMATPGSDLDGASGGAAEAVEVLLSQWDDLG